MLSPWGAAAAVWDGLDAGGFGDGVHLHGLSDTAAPADVGLDDVDGPPFDELGEGMASTVVFACGKRYPRDAAFEFRVSLDVVWWKGFFEPSEVVRAEAFGESECELDVEGHHGVDHELGAITDELPGFGDVLFDEVKAFVALGVVSWIGDLETCEAEFLEPVEVVAGGVERDLVSNGSAKEFVYGSTEEFALEVPEGDVNAGHRCSDDSGESVAVAGAHYQIVHQFDCHAVLAFDERRNDVVDVGCYGLSEGAVAEAISAVLGDGLDPDFR